MTADPMTADPPTADLTFAGAPAVEQPYWDEIAAGRLVFQRCLACSNAWLPPREQCPQCLADDYEWEPAAGGGAIVSWVVYHTAYHPALAGRLPYNVAIIRLDEGPQLISNLVADDLSEPAYDRIRVGGRVRLRIAERHGLVLPLFQPSDEV